MAFYDNFHIDHMTKPGAALERIAARRLLRRIAKYVPRGGNILELGPGHGIFAECCKAAGFAYSAMEANETRAQEMREQGFDVTTGFFPPIRAPKGSLDCVFSKAVIEHMLNWREATQLMESARECLKPGGVIVTVAPDARSHGMHFWDIDYSHTFPTTVINLRRLFIDCGYEILELRYMAGPFFGLARLPLMFLNWLNPARVLNRLFPPMFPLSKLFKLWMTFMQFIFVVARKGGEE